MTDYDEANVNSSKVAKNFGIYDEGFFMHPNNKSENITRVPGNLVEVVGNFVATTNGSHPHEIVKPIW